MRKYKRLSVAVSIALLLSVFPVSAQQSSSTNYRVDETFFGTGGELDASSTNYRSQQAAGSLGVGSISSTSYDADGGYLTQTHGYLEMDVNPVTVSFGTMTSSSTASGAAQGGTCNCTFIVRTYLSSQYVVVSVSNPPTNESGVSLTAKSTQAVPSVSQSVEEFGINVVANTSPSMGANPANYPDNTFADGQAATGYQTTNQFKYGVGDTIARSAATAGNPATGRTDYTISYIAKPKNTTPAGVYTMNHNLVVVPTF